MPTPRKGKTAAPSRRPDSRAEIRRELMSRAVLEPLYSMIEANPRTKHAVIIQLNEQYACGRAKARQEVLRLLGNAAPPPSDATHGYVFCRLTGNQILALLARDNEPSSLRDRIKTCRDGSANPQPPPSPAPQPGFQARAIYKISLDHEVKACLDKSVVTVKADAAQRAFNARGSGIVWAVMDSGIDGTHPHFARNLQVTLPVQHLDFTNSASGPLADEYGHGTHVAGIIAGGLAQSDVLMVREVLLHERSTPVLQTHPIRSLSGMAPDTQLVSLKVLDQRGRGQVSALLDAIDRIQQINDFGRRILIHGVNISLGYDFEAHWFAAGQSPLCVEVDRLVRSGVVVVVAAGNNGHGERLDPSGTPRTGFFQISINDPGNADQAITVGSTHRDMPHTYGISYFSSRGPTADGRPKPDLVAPGERIVSCLTQEKRQAFATRTESDPNRLLYGEDSGTSMAAPHVSGAIAAFLSVHREFIGQPWRVKDVFLAAATDLRRDRYFQGSGLVDLMRALQSV